MSHLIILVVLCVMDALCNIDQGQRNGICNRWKPTPHHHAAILFSYKNCLENSTKNSICLFWSNSSHWKSYKTLFPPLSYPHPKTLTPINLTKMFIPVGCFFHCHISIFTLCEILFLIVPCVFLSILVNIKMVFY